MFSVTQLGRKTRVWCLHTCVHGTKDIFFSRIFHLGPGPTTSPIQQVKQIPSPELKTPERVAVHSPPRSVEFKNEWSYISTPPHAFMACVRNKFPFSLATYQVRKDINMLFNVRRPANSGTVNWPAFITRSEPARSAVTVPTAEGFVTYWHPAIRRESLKVRSCFCTSRHSMQICII
jgi:hypothetical protein